VNVVDDSAPAVEEDRLADPRIDDVLKRLDAPGGYEAFAEAVRRAGCCRRPLRLTGRVTRNEGEGPRVVFDTKTLPDRMLLKACGSRRETLCPPCASVYRGDAFQLVAAGLRGGKGVPETVADHPAVLVTLTAPSFGPVHRRTKDDRCHPRGRTCRHGTSLRCTTRHAEGDRLVGQALCPSCYDYDAAVLFNLSVSELWRRTSIYTLRSLGELAGLSVRQVAKVVRLSYVKVIEFQRRGVVHVHAVVRLDAVAEELVGPPEGFNADLLARAVAVAVRKVHAPVAGQKGRGAVRVRWGRQLDVTVVAEACDLRRRAASYLAKYSTKSTDETGVLDHRLRVGLPGDADLSLQLRRLVAAAWELGAEGSYRELHVRRWAHTLGFRGHFATKSRRYSTTFGELRLIRQRWRTAESGVMELEFGFKSDQAGGNLYMREWRVLGVGYLSAGDAWLARGMADQRRMALRAAYEERAYEWRRAA